MSMAEGQQQVIGLIEDDLETVEKLQVPEFFKNILVVMKENSQLWEEEIFTTWMFLLSILYKKLDPRELDQARVPASTIREVYRGLMLEFIRGSDVMLSKYGDDVNELENYGNVDEFIEQVATEFANNVEKPDTIYRDYETLLFFRVADRIINGYREVKENYEAAHPEDVLK